jgi:hypothetical protein
MDDGPLDNQSGKSIDMSIIICLIDRISDATLGKKPMEPTHDPYLRQQIPRTAE